jgi:hypothetical protein
VNSLLPAWTKALEDLKQTVPCRSHYDSLDLLAHTRTSIGARIEWCLKQETQVCTRAEREGWRAEEEGPRDALLNRDRTYQYSPPVVFERYAIGLKDGRALISLAWADCLCHPCRQGGRV